MEGNEAPVVVQPPQAAGPNTPQPIQPGMIMYFREAKFNPRGKKQTALRFKGHGFGVFLGHVPQLGMPPPPIFVRYLLANIGYIGTDDIAELMGTAVCEDLVQKMRQKYETLLGIPEAPKPSGLVTPGGNPLQSSDDEKPL